MAWAEAYAEKQGGMQDLIGQIQQQRQAEEEKKGFGIGGVFKLLGGAALMMIGNPLGGTLIASGLGDF